MEPQSCARPPLDSSEEERRRFLEDVQTAKSTATRYLYLIRHGDFNLYEPEDSERKLTALGKSFVRQRCCKPCFFLPPVKQNKNKN
ncbi:hypothetical protein MRX96_059702 [Rhipicephalus microplus]